MLAAQVEIWADTTCGFPILRSAVFGVSNAGPDERNSAFPVLPPLDFSTTEIPAWAASPAHRCRRWWTLNPLLPPAGHS